MWIIDRVVSKGQYNYAVVTDHPNATSRGYVLEHRVVMENHLGRLLEANEIVHHIDENKKNNSIENLEVMSRSSHTKHHAPEASYLELECAQCGGAFTRRANQRAELKGFTNTFCSRSCNGKFQRSKQIEKLKHK